MDLPRRLGGRAPGIQERHDARQAVLSARHRAEQDGRRDDGHRQEMADPRAGGEQHHPCEQRDQHGHREIRLEEDQRHERREHDNEGQQPVLEGADPLTLLRREHRRPDHDPELGELGGLHRHEPEVHPAPGAVDAGGDPLGEGEQREEQQHRDDGEHRPRRPLPLAVVRAGQQRRDDAAHRGAERLLQGEARAHLPARNRQQARGAVHGRQSEHDQDRRDQRQQARLPARVPHICSTSFRKMAPRSS